MGIGADPGISLYKEILDDYEKSHFINADGSSSYMTIVTRTTEILNKHGFSNLNQLQQVMGITIYQLIIFVRWIIQPKNLVLRGILGQFTGMMHHGLIIE